MKYAILAQQKILLSGILSIFLLVFLFTETFNNRSIQRDFLPSPIVTFSPKAIEKVSLKAQAVFVYDFSAQKILYEKNAESQLPLASLTKIMTAYVGKSILPENSLIIIDKDAIQTEGESGLQENERFKLDDLLRLILIESSNDGAAAVQRAFLERHPENKDGFIETMNSQTESLGLVQTYFLTETGLDTNERVAGAYGSAHDVAFLLWGGYNKYPDIFGATEYQKLSISSFDLSPHEVTNTNESLSSIPATIVSKTGYTDLAGGNLALIFEAGPMHPIGIVVLGSGKDERFTDATKLARGVLEGFREE